MNNALKYTALALLVNCAYISHVSAEPQQQEQQHKSQDESKNKADKPNAGANNSANNGAKSTAKSNAKAAENQHQQGNGQKEQHQSAANSHSTDKKSSHQDNGNGHSNASYAIDSHNKQLIKQHYQRALGKVDRSHRPKWQQGEKIPDGYRAYITAAPVSLVSRLPSVPNGCKVGYYQGYTVVYDPTTFVILTLVDLLVD